MVLLMFWILKINLLEWVEDFFIGKMLYLINFVRLCLFILRSWLIIVFVVLNEIVLLLFFLKIWYCVCSWFLKSFLWYWVSIFFILNLILLVF